MQFLQRTRFHKDIVAEFSLPGRHASRKVMIILPGAPGSPGGKSAVVQHFTRKGYWVFLPRYRGTWESGGRFLQRSPHEDVLAILDQLPYGFIDALTGATYTIEPTKVVLIGISFGGPAAALVSRDTRVTKVLLISPVVDWNATSKAEPLSEFFRFTREGFGKGYRFAQGAEARLASGTFYNPMRSISGIDGTKMLILHAQDDNVVSWRPVARFAKNVGAQLVLRKRGGHLSSLILTQPAYYKKVSAFLG